MTATLAGETIKISQEVLKYLVESPALWLGFFLFGFIGDYIPLHGDKTVFDYAMAYTTKKTVKTVLGAPPVKFILNILGRTRFYRP